VHSLSPCVIRAEGIASQVERIRMARKRFFLGFIVIAIIAWPLAACRTTEKKEILFHSDEAHLEVALPAGWAAAEGPERLARPFVGLAAFNSWGESDFWAPEVAKETASGVSRRYGPQDVLGQLPAGGAYVVLVHTDGGPPAAEYGPEHEQRDLSGLWEQQDCREGEMAPGATHANFFKWGRFLRIEVYCTPDASEETAAAVSELLASWRFDPIPVGDVGWAVVEARQMLPPAVEPAGFPIPSESFPASMREGTVTRITRAEVKDQTVVVTFTYRWDEPPSSSGGDECPEGRCHWWRFEARPDGGIVLTEEGGATIQGDSTPTIGLLFPTPSVTEWRRIGNDGWKYAFEVPQSWLLSEPGMTNPDRLVFLSDADGETGTMKLDVMADPLARPGAPDTSGWDPVTVAGTMGWLTTVQGGEASGPDDVGTTVYIPGPEYRYTLYLFCAPGEQAREPFLAECQGILGHILATFQIVPETK